MKPSLRRYTPFQQILERIQADVRLGSVSGTVQLPSISSMAQRYGTSRNTVRKALQQLCDRQQLERSGYKNYIYQTYGDLSRLGRIVFIAEGVSGVFKYSAIELFWNIFQPMMLRKGASLELLLLSEPGELSRHISPSSPPGVIITSYIAPAFTSLLQQLQRTIPVFGILEQHAQVLRNVIALNNREVGRLAARSLLNSGCRKPCAIWRSCDNHDLTERANGFQEELEQHGISGYSTIFWLRHNGIAIPLQETGCQIKWCVQNCYDGVFMLSDELIGELAADFIADGTFPHRMRLITVDSTHSALRHTPSITCIGHANEKVALALFDVLNRPTPTGTHPVRISITPGILPGDLDFPKTER